MDRPIGVCSGSKDRRGVRHPASNRKRVTTNTTPGDSAKDVARPTIGRIGSTVVEGDDRVTCLPALRHAQGRAHDDGADAPGNRSSDRRNSCMRDWKPVNMLHRTLVIRRVGVQPNALMEAGPGSKRERQAPKKSDVLSNETLRVAPALSPPVRAC